MRLTVLDVRDASAWDAFIASVPRTPFLLSWAWGDFRSVQGREIRRLAVVDAEGRWVAAVLAERRVKARGLASFWFAPRGPVFTSELNGAERADAFRALERALRETDGGRAWFLRLEPFLSEVPAEFPGMRRSAAQNPATTVYLDLAPTEDELLGAMHEKTRYNARLAARKGVVVRMGTSEADFGAFLKLMDETASRDAFVQHDRGYLRSTWKALSPSGMARLRIAEHEGDVLAANLEIVFGDTATYLYGASSSVKRNLMAPYAIQWEAIRAAKGEGYAWYDFWGANPVDAQAPGYKPSWEGITRFKNGWGGQTVSFAGTWDIPWKPMAYRLGRAVGGI